MDSIKIIISIFSSAIEFLIEIIFFYLLRKIFEIEIIGYYGVIVSFLMTFQFITDLGFSIAHLKYFPQAENNYEKAVCNGSYSYYRLIQYIAYISIIIIFLPFLQTIQNNLFISYFLSLSIIISIVGKSFFNPLYLSKKFIVKKTIPLLISVILKILLLLIFTLIYNSNILILIITILISNVIYFVLNLLFVRNFKFKRPSVEIKKKYLKYAYPFFIINSLNIIILNIDVLLINIWFPISEVANYYTAKQIYSFLIIFVMSISEILLTTFSKNLKMEKNDLNLKLMREIDQYLNLFIVPIIMLAILYSTDIIVLIFGEYYRLTGVIFIILSFNLFTISVSIAYLVQLQAIGEVKFIAKITILRHVIGIISMIILIPPFMFNLGIIGAGISFTLTEFITHLIFRIIGFKKYNLGFYWGSIRNIIIMIFVFFIQVFIDVIYSYPFYLIPFFMLFDIFLYFLINYLFKGFSKQDIIFLLNVFNYRNIKRVVISELKSK